MQGYADFMDSSEQHKVSMFNKEIKIWQCTKIQAIVIY